MPAVLAPLLSIAIFLGNPFVRNIRVKNLVAAGLLGRRETARLYCMESRSDLQSWVLFSLFAAFIFVVARYLNG